MGAVGTEGPAGGIAGAPKAGGMAVMGAGAGDGEPPNPLAAHELGGAGAGLAGWGGAGSVALGAEDAGRNKSWFSASMICRGVVLALKKIWVAPAWAAS